MSRPHYTGGSAGGMRNHISRVSFPLGNVMTPRAPCRLYAIMARESNIAVVFRRGPSKRVQLILWRTDCDDFIPGQWLKGRIYQHRCDLSPSGRRLIYFAANHKPPFYSWTAISQPPFLTALALWPKGDCWDGGGLFEREDSIWLNHPEAESMLAKGSLPPGFEVRHNSHCIGGEDAPILDDRLERDGWFTEQELEVEEIIGRPYSSEEGERLKACMDEAPEEFQSLFRELDKPIVTGYRTISPLVRTKRSQQGLAIRETKSITGLDSCIRFSVMQTKRDVKGLPGVTWADFDQSGRLVFARGGQLFAGTWNGNELAERELIDLNQYQYTEIKSPDWARSW
jgi:hypothetical protein